MIKSESNMKVDNLEIEVFKNRKLMGAKAAEDIIGCINRVILEKGRVRMIFAAAPSQNDMLEVLRNTKKVDWTKVEVFHMDEYIGLDKEAPQRFSNFLKEKLFDKISLKGEYLIDQNDLNVEDEIKRYSSLLTEDEIDIVCLGIGENGHIAFNDPDVADFNDEKVVKVVQLDEICRQQQVNDGCFNMLSEVPNNAITLTIPTLLKGKELFCVVPGITKKNAVQQMLTQPISEKCPASILRQHKNCTLYLDKNSYYK